MAQKATSEERLEHLRRHAIYSQEAVESYELQLEIGRRSLLDLLNASNEPFNTCGALIVGRYEDI